MMPLRWYGLVDEFSTNPIPFTYAVIFLLESAVELFFCILLVILGGGVMYYLDRMMKGNINEWKIQRNEINMLKDQEDVTYLRIEIIKIRGHISINHLVANPNVTILVNLCLQFKRNKNDLLRRWHGTVPQHARGMGEVIEYADIVDDFLDTLQIDANTLSAKKVITDRQYLINHLR